MPTNKIRLFLPSKEFIHHFIQLARFQTLIVHIKNKKPYK